MSDTTLGKILNGSEPRDAIHIAVAPVRAAKSLSPGQHVGLDRNGNADNKVKKTIGIVDPFLTDNVEKGEYFYICLYQKTVTGMTHHWNHPDFKDSESFPEVKLAETPVEEKAIKSTPYVTDSLTNVTESMQWISNYAENLNVSYRELMQAASDYINHGTMFCRSYFEGVCVHGDFWRHYENITGEKSEGSFFTCSC